MRVEFIKPVLFLMFSQLRRRSRKSNCKIVQLLTSCCPKKPKGGHVQEAVKEARILKNLSHPNIVEFKVALKSQCAMLLLTSQSLNATRIAFTHPCTPSVLAGSIRGEEVSLLGDGLLRLRRPQSQNPARSQAKCVHGLSPRRLL